MSFEDDSSMDKLKWRVKCIENTLLNYRLTTNETVEAETEYGKVRGVKRLTVYEDSYYSFEGIPYAQPPVGELRFKAPQRPTPWDGVRDCSNNKDQAMQRDFILGKVCGSEDCLYLSIYTNNLTPETKRPVLVFIHGSGFVMSNSRDWYGPDYFIKKDIVLVTIQYRLGVLGFLSLNTEDLNIPGNAGLKDQVMALRWIKNNCSNFGGNPENITVFGESAGGASLHYMMLTEQTRNLFHRAVLMSDNAMAPWPNNQNQHRGYTLAKLAGYEGEDNDKDVLEFLVKAKSHELITWEDKVLTAEEHKNQVMFAFCPTVEPYQTADCVIPKHPREMVKTAWGNSIPTMMGCTSKEYLICLSMIEQMPEIFEEDDPTDENLMEIYSHIHFWFPWRRLLRLRFNHTSGTPVYLYRFDFKSREMIGPYRKCYYGECYRYIRHANELVYLFWNMFAKRFSNDSEEYKTIERTVSIWTNFATIGNPYNSEIDGMEFLVWDPIKKTDDIYKCLNISDELKIVDFSETDAMKIWESFFEKSKDLF